MKDIGVLTPLMNEVGGFVIKQVEEAIDLLDLTKRVRAFFVRAGGEPEGTFLHEEVVTAMNNLACTWCNRIIRPEDNSTDDLASLAASIALTEADITEVIAKLDAHFCDADKQFIKGVLE